MISWHAERELPVPIETAWHVFDFDNLPRVIPNVVKNEMVDRKPGVVGSTYRQTYRDGNRTETYIVTELAYVDRPDYKHDEIGFTIAGMFDIRASFTLRKLDEDRCVFIYSGTNRGTNLVAKGLLKLGGEERNDKIVREFLDRVEQEALRTK
ncbi:SRPBCC family protein [Exiguobacterium flavidum]|uniref:SRPBCC family protein n=1 Tax=Exiguobacterium flavidum TaxID=2184695 RepID=UPI000DF78498|nr:SRPBCC family protein [Exiguobacterium flavidum]